MARYNDYENESSFEKFTHHKKKKFGKGHQSKHGSKYDVYESIYEDTPYEEAPMFKPAFVNNPPVKSVATTPASSERVYGPNTREIKSVKIDYDGVADIQKIDNPKDGVTTYGIKYIFTGKKGLFRIIWFNVNSRLRDSVYNTEYNFWLSLKK